MMVGARGQEGWVLIDENQGYTARTTRSWGNEWQHHEVPERAHSQESWLDGE